MGRTTAIDQPDTTDASGNPIANITRTAYHPSGEIKAVWGDQTNPTYRLYDEQNRLTGLRTYRGIAHNVEPTAATTGFDPTTWNYHPQRGWLVSKRDAANLGADYTYSPAGRLATRRWARTTVGNARLTTTYGYDAGKLVSTTYNDGITPNVTYAYDAFGRQTQVTQEGNSWTYTYDPATLLPDTETVTYDTDDDGTGDFTRVLDRSHDANLRPTGYQLKNGATVETQAAYTYDAAGRLATVGDGTDTFTYGYVENSHLLHTVTGPVHTVTNEWDTTRDALLDKQNEVGGLVISGYEYTVNAIGQRGAMERSSDVSTGSSVEWSYNARGEVISADHSEQAQRRWYEYDAIGNRKITMNGQSDNSGGYLNSDLTIDCQSTNSLNQYTKLVFIQGGNPRPWEKPEGYDTDGNRLTGTNPMNPLQSGGYTWDAENRLLQARIGNVTVGEYRYDPFGRRIMKTVGTGGPTGPTSTVFVYDGWNPIGEYVSNAGSWNLKTSLLWGQDLSGSMQGAGGVGGLLSTMSHGPSSVERFHLTYDGNGNVGQYLDASGAVAAHFEYDPFGQVTLNTDSTNRFPIRFSTKWQDFETGLNYYGYRYYDPQQGRWLNRDPIQEEGGMNLYGFVGNDGIGSIDLLGLVSFPMPNGWENFDCKKLLDLARDIAEHIVKRRKDMLEDKCDLFGNPNPPLGKGTWRGHGDMFENSQRQLRKVLDKMDSNKCPPPPQQFRRISTESKPSKPTPKTTQKPYIPQPTPLLYQQASGMAFNALGAGLGAGALVGGALGGGAALTTPPGQGAATAAAPALGRALVPALAH